MKREFLLFSPLLMAACMSTPAPAEVDAALAAPDCSVETFAIYFEDGASELSAESDAGIDAV